MQKPRHSGRENADALNNLKMSRTVKERGSRRERQDAEDIRF
jgi:hypothetical protein